MKKLLYEAPIDDFLSSDAKEKIIKAQNRKYQSAKEGGGSSNNMGYLMSYLPSLELEHKTKLLNLAKAIFLSKFPKIKERVDKGVLTLDVDFSSNPSIRTKTQTISTDQVNKAKEIDPDFEERIKARNFINATTQGTAWADGFNAYKEVESQLENLDPELLKKYKEFKNSATVFYNDNTQMLERMAQQSVGRVAFADVRPDESKPGNWIIEVRAPHFPLLVHELFKAGRYYNSILFMPKDKNVSNTLKDTTDTHKHEIKNMITGREISSKLKYLWGELIDGYEPWMDGMIQTQFNRIANDDVKLHNYIMYNGVLDGDQKAMDLFEKYSQKIVNSILKNPPKIEKPDYNKIIKTEKKPETIEPEEDDDFNPDDWDTFDFDDDND
jgi:hypothetical protein